MRLIPQVFTILLHLLTCTYNIDASRPCSYFDNYSFSTINSSKVIPCMCISLGGKQSFGLLDHPFPTPPQVPDRDGLAIVTRLFPDT